MVSKMVARSREEKLLETTLLAALNRKNYIEQLVKETPSERNRQWYKESCDDCKRACENLREYYNRGSEELQ